MCSVALTLCSTYSKLDPTSPGVTSGYLEFPYKQTDRQTDRQSALYVVRTKKDVSHEALRGSYVCKHLSTPTKYKSLRGSYVCKCARSNVIKASHDDILVITVGSHVTYVLALPGAGKTSEVAVNMAREALKEKKKVLITVQTNEIAAHGSVG
uniref:ResIII domain-containing protein n=1 Tax=Haemonchus contortus TaxID=6289 RepID=A0A7I4YC88_HAECO